jgi:DNA-directed RNA polymerase subunit RPC12/RpoP
MNLQPYIYDNGFSKRYYVCSECGSKAMRSENVDGCVTLYYLCMDCGSVEHAPKWEEILEPKRTEKIPSEAWISREDFLQLAVFRIGQFN